ncbi:glycoside hydrolase family 92 protein [Phellopilus nigrolimitatus]|nr:glycoside hydrolase family 92 protein [Phellopilus nigrolimitatus]
MDLTSFFAISIYIGAVFAHVPRAIGSVETGIGGGLNLSEPLSLVNVFIGTTNGGNVFPGATVPHGMAKVGMDTDSPHNQAGYDANSTFNATGFSQLHDSGTGGGVPLSNFKLWPFASCNSTFESCQTSIDGRKALRKILGDGTPDDFGSPGYFSTNLSTGVRVELTSTRRTALHRYTFPTTSTEPRIVVDITNDGQQSSTNPFMNIDPGTGRVIGSADFAASFGPGRYSAFACFDFRGDGYNFSAPAEYGSWLGNFPVRFTTNLQQVYFGFISELGALLTFPPNPSPGSTTTILARVSVSFISTDQACANAESEIPDFDFDGTLAASQSQWEDILKRVRVETENVDDDIVEMLYSSLYRTHISPADYTDENPKWNSSEPYYDSLYCNWDTFRTLYPLYSLHDPENFARIVRGQINIQQHEGWLPECRGATAQQFIQGGSNGDPILGEFFVKFYEQADALNFSAADLYSALLADAEDQPPDWDLQGRQANIWKILGYIPGDIYETSGTNTKQVSRTLEHAFGDFAISQVAQILGKTDDVAKYQNRSGNFFNVWNPNVTVPNSPSSVKGMMQPRFANGTFNYTDPRHCSVNDPLQSTCFLNAANRDGFYESSPIVYSQFVPHDTARLIDLQGGNENFISRLDFIFDQNYFDSTDEPSQQIPFMYHYANRPGLSTQRSRQVIATDFNTSVNGLPGNDGAMASYAFFYLAGLYPVPATRQFLLSSPYFPQISFFNPLFNSTTTIKANGFQENPANGTGGHVFVESVKVNGQPYKTNCFLEWAVFQDSATVELQLSSDINVSCGNGSDALPPSLSTGGFSSI